MIRLSIGLEHPKDIWADLKQDQYIMNIKEDLQNRILHGDHDTKS